MSKRSKIDELPDEVRAWLEGALVTDGFQRYELLEQLLADKGFAIGKSTIHRFGQKLQRRLDAIKASSQAALLVAKHTGDDADSMSRAVTSMVQSQMFEVMVNLQDLEDDGVNPEKRAVLLAKIAGGVADLSRASVSLRKWEIEVRNKAATAAEKVDQIARKGGLSAAAANQIRKEILGIAS